MFCFQRTFGLPTEVITPEQFWAIVKSPETYRKVSAGREFYDKGDKAQYDRYKKGLPLMIFIGTFDEWDKEFENKQTGEKIRRSGRWRCQKHCRLNGLVVADYDHLEGDVREIWAESYDRLSDEDKARIVLVFVTPSGHGLKVVFTADPAVGNLIDNISDFSIKLSLKADESGKDGSRGAFMTTADDIISINEEKLFAYENKEFTQRYNALYRDGHSQGTQSSKGSVAFQMRQAELSYNGVAISEIIAKWMEGVDLTNNRHNTLVELASHLRYIIGKNSKKITEVVMTLPWVQDLAKEGEDVAGTVSSVMDFKYREYMPKRMKAAAEPQHSDDVYAVLPLDKWAEELAEMAQYYPCMKELFLNVHPHKLPAVFFSSAALFGTLMTRAWYHFWFAPKIIRRLNYCIFIIGDPGAGKHMIEEFYKIIADPMIQADQCLIDAVNRYKEGRTERSTSTKAQKGEALKRPVVGIRVHPARTATGEFIRHMNSAVETVQGVPLNLHMFSFDAELDNVTKQNKGGDWKDREVLELKAFHNEEDGQMYANQESVTGMFNVYWNFIYTGTPYALHRKVSQRNFGTGMSTRLAVIPLPDKGAASRHQEVIENAEEVLRGWAYRLDRVEGELPIEPLNDETYDWQTSHLEIAEFNGDKADRTLLKRIPYYGIGISLPFILMRHWDEWQEQRTLTMDDMDCRLCRLAMEIQYKCQQFFFGEMAFNYFADQNKEFVQHRRTTRYDECFRKLPDEFKTQQFMDCFNCSQPSASKAINRFQNEKIVERVKYGLYRKLVNELP
ncbi:MAG: hypothetical protein IJ580_08080 [Prevotella sp.]|nr:hypothetical protein [Prevotella sp.]